MGCYHVDLPNGGHGIICGKLGQHCAHCARVGDYLCDYPVGKGRNGQPRTCDAPLCEVHAFEIGPDLHYCPAHNQRWQLYLAEGGEAKELANVTPYRRNPKQEDLF